jgi:hypothetical protein
MKNQLIGTLVGAILLFVWQFLSWSMLNVHGNEFQYTENQDAIMEVLSQNLKTGSYFIPGVAPGTSMEEEQAYMQSQIGKPWAQIHYHESFDTAMGMSLFRGFGIDLVAVFLLVWMLSKMSNLMFSNALLSSLAVGIIAYLTIPYLNSVWFDSDSWAYLIDAIVQWGLVGTWLGWWMTRK